MLESRLSFCRGVQDVVVKVILASICGSDMHPYAGRGVRLDDGIIFGHEFVGEVVDVGSEVHRPIAHAHARRILHTHM